MKKLLEGKVVIITGAGSGMGLCAAKLFYAEGARLVLADITGKAQQVAAELGERAVGITTDVRLAADVDAMVELAVKKFGGVDVLCNVAGVSGALVPLTETDEQNFDFMIDVNLRGPFLTMKRAIPEIKKRGGGTIVNIASTAALIGTPNIATYAASKAGLVALSRSAALEYAKSGIRINLICPGVIETPMYTSGMQENPEMVEYLKRLIPMGRTGQPEEIACAMLFLASDLSSYMTGAVLPLEGGQVTA